MPNVAVRFFDSYPETDRHGPANWPSDVREIGEETSYTEGEYSWAVMSVEVYESYCAAHLAEYEAWVASRPQDPLPVICAAIERARQYGLKLMAEFAARNILSGITVAQVRALANKMDALETLVNAGSLATAKEELDNILLDDFFTAECRDSFKQKIQDYLDGKVS